MICLFLIFFHVSLLHYFLLYFTFSVVPFIHFYIFFFMNISFDQLVNSLFCCFLHPFLFIFCINFISAKLHLLLLCFFYFISYFMYPFCFLTPSNSQLFLCLLMTVTLQTNCPFSFLFLILFKLISKSQLLLFCIILMDCLFFYPPNVSFYAALLPAGESKHWCLLICTLKVLIFNFHYKRH